MFLGGFKGERLQVFLFFFVEGMEGHGNEGIGQRCGLGFLKIWNGGGSCGKEGMAGNGIEN